MNQPPLPPFCCTFTSNLPELLRQIACSIAITTYQAGKVVFISPKNESEIIQLPRTFNKAMGLTLLENKMAIATKDEVLILMNSQQLAVHYPRQPNIYDGLFVPRATYYTGQVDIHDLFWGNKGLWAINTSFSTLCLIDDNYSFTPVWKPPFITQLAHEDRCHLNGLAMANGEPLYVSALGESDSPRGWKKNITTGGIILHIPSGEIIAANLSMPHSPRLLDGKIYFLQSAKGELCCIDVTTAAGSSRKVETVINLGCFVRGMAIYKDYAFIGMSRLRERSASMFKDLPIAQKSNYGGIKIMHLPTASIVAEIIYKSSVEEIYDVQILPGLLRPGILNTQNDIYKFALSLPKSTFWATDEIKKQLDK